MSAGYIENSAEIDREKITHNLNKKINKDLGQQFRWKRHFGRLLRCSARSNNPF